LPSGTADHNRHDKLRYRLHWLALVEMPTSPGSLVSLRIAGGLDNDIASVQYDHRNHVGDPFTLPNAIMPRPAVLP
jgi:hypothetical protein